MYVKHKNYDCNMCMIFIVISMSSLYTNRNSIIALFLLYRRRKHRRNMLHWVHPKGKNSVPFTHYLVNYEMTQTSFFKIIFKCLFRLLTKCIAI